MQRFLQPTAARLTRPTASMMRTFSSSTKDFVGVVGVGLMGGHMSDNLMAKGKKIVVCDPNPASTKRLADKGAIVAKTPREVAEKCDTVITMLPNTAVVESVYLGKDGFAGALRPGHFFVDSSTIDAVFTKKLSQQLHDKNVKFVDAPVSGGVVGAENGTLTFMVGGTEDEYAAITPFLQFMGKNIVHCGQSGTGQVAKVCNNLALAIQMASVAEAMNLGVKLGVEPAVLRGIMNTSTSQCWSTTVYHPYPGLMENVPAANNYNGGFACNLVKKDLGLGVDAAKQAEVTLPLTFAVHQLYSMIVNDGHGNKDIGYILQYLKGKNAQ